MTKIDIILPFHKVDELLIRALASVDNSVGVKPRIILIGKRLSEREREVFKFMKSPIVYIEFTTQPSYADALNIGLNNLNSEYFGLMNSDDLVSSTRLKKQIEALVHNSADVSICKLIKFTEKYNDLPSLGGKLDLNNYDSKLLLLGAYGADASLVGVTSVISKLKLKFENSDFADWIFALEHYPKLRIIFVPTAEYFYRMHKGQSTHHLFREKSYYLLEEKLMKFAEKCKIDNLSKKSIAAMAMPNRLTKLSKREFFEFLDYADQLKIAFQSNVHGELQLIEQRISISAFRNCKIHLLSYKQQKIALKYLVKSAWTLIRHFKYIRFNRQLIPLRFL